MISKRPENILKRLASLFLQKLKGVLFGTMKIKNT